MTDTHAPTAALRSIAVAVDDTAAAEQLLATLVDLPVTVRDGHRWTALDAGGLTLALTTAAELPAGASVSINVRVADVAAAYETLLAAGAQSLSAPALGPHEERAAVLLGGCVALSVYRSVPAA
ncbi:VOC family protein [Dactylosporangium sp. CA-139066]|uniref:VOC family protein n=1 Tax=Dactylosporangium sp. CA-139066 TaxID=3239930 RepID=UPI003D938A65